MNFHNSDIKSKIRFPNFRGFIQVPQQPRRQQDVQLQRIVRFVLENQYLGDLVSILRTPIAYAIIPVILMINNLIPLTLHPLTLASPINGNYLSFSCFYIH